MVQGDRTNSICSDGEDKCRASIACVFQLLWTRIMWQGECLPCVGHLSRIPIADGMDAMAGHSIRPTSRWRVIEHCATGTCIASSRPRAIKIAKNPRIYLTSPFSSRADAPLCNRDTFYLRCLNVNR